MTRSSTTGKADKLPTSKSTQPCLRFSLPEIQSATKEFDEELVIGQGGFGKVYKGIIFIEETSHVVAIKRLDSKSTQGAPEFRAEINMLSKLRHCHLVSLIGYCDDNNEMILVYTYMPNGTLYHHLHKADRMPLNWMQRLKIAIGAGLGLDYLHTGFGTQHGVIHRDVKSSNILLDENWEAMISDFGLSKIGPTNQSSSYVDASVKGTFGYLDPEFFYTRKLTRKTDVYAFGVVLFELLSGRLAVDERNGEDHCSLVRWAQKCVKERKLDKMVDSSIRGTIFPRCLRGFATIAYRFLHGNLRERPTMAEVVVTLQALLVLQQRYDSSAEPSGLTGFTWKIHKYLVSTTKQNAADQSGTSSSQIPENMNKYNSAKTYGSDQFEIYSQHRELVATDLNCFTYYELICATKSFQNRIYSNHKSYAKVYKGWIDKKTYFPCKDNTRLPIAVKRLISYKFVNRLDFKMLKKFNHPNLEKLIGYSMQLKQLFLVYEFMPNGNFEDLLRRGAAALLTLVTKVKIAVGIARGLVFLHKTQDQVRAYPSRKGTVSESRLDRHKILLDEDFTAKLSDYDVIKLVHGRYPPNAQASNDIRLSHLQSNLSGFTVVFAEVLTGKQIPNQNEFQKIDDLFIEHGKLSLVHIAKLCFEICNDVDSESKMLTILEEYEQYIPPCQNEEFRPKTFESCLLETTELPFSARVNVIEGVSRGHVLLHDKVARESPLEMLG